MIFLFLFHLLLGKYFFSIHTNPILNILINIYYFKDKTSSNIACICVFDPCQSIITIIAHSVYQMLYKLFSHFSFEKIYVSSKANKENLYDPHVTDLVT